MAANTRLQNIALGILILFTALGGIAVILRLWSRKIKRSAPSADDYLMVVGYVLSVIQTITSWYYIKANFVGWHYKDIPPTEYDAKTAMIWNYVVQLVYNPALTFIKLSILLFLRRLDSHSRVVSLLFWFATTFVIGLFVTVLFVDIFQCQPVAHVYDSSIEGTCIAQGVFYVSTAALNLFTDVIVMAIPIIITWKLQMPVRQKLAVCLILCLGGVATAIGVWRLVILTRGFILHVPNPDPTYDISFVSSAIECNTAVLTACAPSMKAIARRYVPRLLGTSRRDTSGYGAGTSGSRGRFPGSNLFSGNKSQLRSHADDEYEMADPNNGVSVSGGKRNSSAFDMRKYRRNGDSVSLSSGSLEGATGIVKTMDVSVQYTGGGGTRDDGRSRDNKHSSVDSLV
ncbi:Uncharacterized protein PECH_004300 [Penicillium ucsense]|uniref:Rhodopsin domain-containing protein n=1 Tax=Penicillium ucsense TaxID=2839758 RepID=A0A8J8WLV3_9EURO|nr:Uncharacterized protein PECM_001137 [Penicillium ucsense]KAF7737185.1 Uncharacterized protein PECH_004300 [Penicillium ucsense]